MATATKEKWRVLARHNNNWVRGARITESVLEDDGENMPSIRRFTATIDGFNGFRIFQGPAGPDVVRIVKRRVQLILDRMKRSDDYLFCEAAPAECPEAIADILERWNLPPTPGKYLVCVNAKREGVFLVRNKDLVLDRKTYKEIAAEASGRGIKPPFVVYCRVSCYSGPGLEVIQIGAE